MNDKQSKQHRKRSFGTVPTAAGEILARSLNTRRLSKTLERYSLFANWNEIVGEDIASKASPKKMLRGTTLLLEVCDPVWVQELSLQKVSLLRQINEKCQGTLVDDIHFTAGSPKHP